MMIHASGLAWLAAGAGVGALLTMASGAQAAGATTRPAAGPASQPERALRVGGLKVNRVLFLGNSITLHGPAANIGWAGNWGMAATAAEKDYVHVLTRRLAKAAGAAPEIRVSGAAEFERGFATFDVAAGLRDDVAFKADLVIVALGENVPELTSEPAKAGYRAAFARLLAELKKDNAPGELKKANRPALFVRSSFWPNATKDGIMRAACAEAGGVFVDISVLAREPSNYARSEQTIAHAGVAAHPGDRGMSAIADALWSAIAKRGAATTQAD